MKPEPFKWKWLIEIEESPLTCSMFQGKSETRNIKPHHGPQPSNSLFKSRQALIETGKMPRFFFGGRRGSGNCSFIVYRHLPLSVKRWCDVFVKMGDYYNSSSVAKGELLVSTDER